MRLNKLIELSEKLKNETLLEYRINCKGFELKYFAFQEIVEWLDYLYKFYSTDTLAEKKVEIVEINNQACFECCHTVAEQLKQDIEYDGWYLHQYNCVDLESYCYIVSNKHLTKFYIFANNSIKHCKIQAMRIVREILTYLLIVSGWVMLHASAIKYQKKGIILIGERYAGKTYTMLDVLSNTDAEFISNDKIFVKEVQDKIEIFALPKKIGIRWSTINENSHYLPSVMPFYSHSVNQYINRKEFVIENQNDLNKKIYLLPNELANILNNRIATECNLDIILELNQMKNKNQCIQSISVNSLLLEDCILDITKESYLLAYDGINTKRYINNLYEALNKCSGKINACVVSKPYILEQLLEHLNMLSESK